MNIGTVISRITIPAVCLLMILSCNRNPLKVDISEIDSEVKVVPFGEELFSLPLKDTLTELRIVRERHPDFFDLFTWKVINAGGIEENYFARTMGQFLTDTMVLRAKHLSEKIFNDFQNTEDELIQSFKYYKYHFPDKELPVIYTMISGFNQSVVTADNIIGISLDKYLGRDFSTYHYLSNVPLYKITNMHPAKIVPDVAYAWGMTEFDESRHATTLLDHIIAQGKLMYLQMPCCLKYTTASR